MTYFRHSFVADHFQYLASMGPLALLAAGATIRARSTFGGNEAPRLMLGGAVLLLAGVISWQRADGV